ncbi:MAG: hypothetical protein GXY58_07305 [Planctomycetaceae bacterium]|nr:hypothetical protein [Planctomycetaceae bacterium]
MNDTVFDFSRNLVPEQPHYDRAEWTVWDSFQQPNRDSRWLNVRKGGWERSSGE